MVVAVLGTTLLRFLRDLKLPVGIMLQRARFVSSEITHCRRACASSESVLLIKFCG